MEIQALHRQGYSIRRIAKEPGVSRNTVRHYLRGKVSIPTYSQRDKKRRNSLHTKRIFSNVLKPPIHTGSPQLYCYVKSKYWDMTVE